MVWLAKIAVIFTLALVGLLALIHARRIRARANAAVGWPAVKATVIDLHYYDDVNDGGADPDAQEVRITYEYRVRGKVHRGSTISFGYSASSNPDYHQRIYAILSRTPTLMVHHNPDDPAESVISPVGGSAPTILSALGTVFLTFGIGFGLMLLIDSTALAAVVMILMVLVFLAAFWRVWTTLTPKLDDALIHSLERRKG
jgi:hypothetical protein